MKTLKCISRYSLFSVPHTLHLLTKKQRSMLQPIIHFNSRNRHGDRVQHIMFTLSRTNASWVESAVFFPKQYTRVSKLYFCERYTFSLNCLFCGEKLWKGQSLLRLLIHWQSRRKLSAQLRWKSKEEAVGKKSMTINTSLYECGISERSALWIHSAWVNNIAVNVRWHWLMICGGLRLESNITQQ